MDTHFISSLQETLKKALNLLEELPTSLYNDSSIGPFYSSVGGHIRHILDFYTSVFNGLDSNSIDLTDRERDCLIEIDINYAKSKIRRVLDDLEEFTTYKLDARYELIDDLGQGTVNIPTNLYAILVQANSHTIHHYAIISHLLYAYDIVIKDQTFGYNPTTPVKKVLVNR